MDFFKAKEKLPENLRPLLYTSFERVDQKDRFPWWAILYCLACGVLFWLTVAKLGRWI